MSQKTRLWQGIRIFEEHLEKWESTSFESLDIGAMEAEVVRYETLRATDSVEHPDDSFRVGF